MRASPEQGKGGWIEQQGTPAEVYRRPATEYVARFLGFHNLLPGEVIARVDGAGAGYRVATSAGPLVAADTPLPLAPGARVTVLIRPEAATVVEQHVEDSDEEWGNRLEGVLVSSSFRGSYYLVRTAHLGDVSLV
jgi:ABC-type Fe3+/spermidine/putrescine transport system ATPase subunit